ncbi:MAG: hypothetical protein KBT06_06840 [Prevotellaceae bacterium]|nr:hypothetical protein [Candidatus Colivivens equi]
MITAPLQNGNSRYQIFSVLTLTAGGDLFTVGKLMGHTDIKSTQVYADVVMDTKIDAVNRMTSFFS